MDHAARRRIRGIAAVTAGTLVLSPVLVTPHHTPVPIRVSSESVQLTDAWFDLLDDTLTSAYYLGQLAGGGNPTYPLPNPIFIAPIAAQLVINSLTYAVQLFTGQGSQIPTEIITHINNLANIGTAIVNDVLPVIVKQVQNPFIAAKNAIDSITSSGNPLLGLFEAPAVFLDGILNGQYGLIGFNGPIAVGFIIRNVIANALYTAPPAGLPFKKPAAALTPKADAAKTVTLKVPTKSGTASSARSKPKAPANSSRKATAAKSDAKGGGARSKRG